MIKGPSNNVRKYQRIKAHSNIYYICTDEFERNRGEGIGSSLNISQGGIMLETLQFVEALFIDLNIWGVRSEMVTVKGLVVYSAIGQNGRYKTGVEFTSPQAARVQAITTLVKSHYRSKTKYKQKIRR